MHDIKQCQVCRGLSDEDICPVCSDPRRNERVLCIVETAADMMAIEQTAGFNGKYFVLGGHLSPIDGIGVEAAWHQSADWVVKATPSCASPSGRNHLGNQYHGKKGKPPRILSVKRSSLTSPISTRIAQGIPMGGELEYLDSMTLGQALQIVDGYKIFSSVWQDKILDSS